MPQLLLSPKGTLRTSAERSPSDFPSGVEQVVFRRSSMRRAPRPRASRDGGSRHGPLSRRVPSFSVGRPEKGSDLRIREPAPVTEGSGPRVGPTDPLRGLSGRVGRSGRGGGGPGSPGEGTVDWRSRGGCERDGRRPTAGVCSRGWRGGGGWAGGGVGVGRPLRGARLAQVAEGRSILASAAEALGSEGPKGPPQGRWERPPRPPRASRPL